MRRFVYAAIGLSALCGMARLAHPAPSPESAPASPAITAPPGGPTAVGGPPAGPGDMLQKLKEFFGPIQTIDRVAENLYWIRGGGGNTVVWVWSHGVLLVDPKLPSSGERIRALVRTVTDKPITHIVDTHAHLDHAGANAEFGTGVEIIAQKNTRTHLLQSSQYKGDASKPGVPTRTFSDHLRLFEGKDAVDLYYFGPAHTDGDAFVVFPSAHVMHSGDVFSRKELPKIDFQNGGSGIAFPATVAKAVAGIRGVEHVIGGHGDEVMSWHDFVGHASLTRQWLEFERSQQRAGGSYDKTLQSFVMPEGFKDYTRGLGGFGGVNAVRGTFEELAR